MSGPIRTPAASHNARHGAPPPAQGRPSAARPGANVSVEKHVMEVMEVNYKTFIYNRLCKLAIAFLGIDFHDFHKMQDRFRDAGSDKYPVIPPARLQCPVPGAFGVRVKNNTKSRVLPYHPSQRGGTLRTAVHVICSCFQHAPGRHRPKPVYATVPLAHGRLIAGAAVR